MMGSVLQFASSTMLTFLRHNGTLMGNIKNLLVVLFLPLNIVITGCVAATNGTESAESETGNVLDNPVIQIANMRYEGAFIIDSSEFGYSAMHDAEGGMAYAPPKPDAPYGSIYATGNRARGGVSEWAIPGIVKSDNVNELNVSEQPLQTFVDLGSRAKNRRADMGYFADLLWIDNQLIYSEHNYYPASNLDLHKMGVVRDADNLENSPAAGYFRLNALSGEESADSYTAHASSGWMSKIPEEWQAILGGTHMLGPADGWNVEGRFSAGPSVFAFNPETDIVSKEPDAIVDSTPLVDYATENPITDIGIVGGEYINAPHDLWNSMSFVHFGFIPRGSRTLMLVGKHWGLDGDIGYKIVQDTGRLCGGPCPYTSADEANYYWLIDLKEVVEARNGLRRYDSIVPYAYGPLPLPFQQDRDGNDRVNDVRGGAYDTNTGIVYLQIKGGDPRHLYDKTPVIVAYTFDTSSEYPVPVKPVWTEVAGEEPNAATAPTFTVSCQSCDTTAVEVKWQIPAISTNASSIRIDHFRVQYENVDLPRYNHKRGQRIGVTVAGNETRHVQELAPGNWRVIIRAISSDGVPSEL